MNNLKMIKMESFIAFTIPSLQNKRNLCFPSYRKHIDLIPLINDNGSKNKSLVCSRVTVFAD